MWMQDVRYAIRLLRRSPGFAITATLTLALSIGANAAIWSAVKGILIAPLPYADPDRLVRLFEEAPRSPKWPMAPADFRDYRNELQTFENIAAYVRADLQLGDPGRPEQLRGMRVTRGFFTLLRRLPKLGRDFEEQDELPGNGDKVILSHGLWMRRFEGDPNVVGRTVRLSGKPFEIVGVLDQGFQHVGGTFRTYGHGEPVDVWSPLAVPRDEEPSWRYSHFFNVVGRTKTEATSAQIAADLKARGESAARRYPVPNSPWKPRIEPLKQEIIGTADKTLMALSGAAMAMLLLACVNVAGLLLGRSAQRGREIGTRAAIGATRWQIARQLLIESVVLAAGGGLAGVGIALGATRALKQFGPADMPRLQNIAVDTDVLLTTVGATLASAVLVGMAPAIRLARTSLSEALKEGARTLAGGSHQRTGKAFAAAEIALAFVLVVSGSLLLKSFVKMISKDPGFQPRGAITASLELPTARYNADAARDFHRRAQERIQSLPGITHAAFSSDLPWTGYDENTGFDIVGKTFPDQQGPAARYHFLTPGYPKATGVPLVAGTDIGPEDQPDAPMVVLLNEAAAKKYWTTAQAAVGARLNLWGMERTVKGVIGDVTELPWDDRSAPALYFPQAQRWYPQPMFLIARTDADPARVIDSIRRALREIDPELPLWSVRPLETVATGALATRRLTLWLISAFGVTSLLLAVVGVYGVMAQVVGQRKHEIGIRQALGATRRHILHMILSSGAVLVFAGLAGGMALAAGSTRLLVSLLYGATPLDPATFITVAGVLVVVAMAAVYLPARQATRFSAVVSLRSP
jgi:putative ABC transport system permease protein